MFSIYNRNDPDTSTDALLCRRRRIPERLLFAMMTRTTVLMFHHAKPTTGHWLRGSNIMHNKHQQSLILSHDDSIRPAMNHIAALYPQGKASIHFNMNQPSLFGSDLSTFSYINRNLKENPINENNNNNNTTTADTTTHDGGDAFHNEHYRDKDEVIHIENSNYFQIIFPIVLGIIFFVRLLMCAILIKYRKDSNLQLAQPMVLSALLISGSISIISCIFFMHTDNDDDNNNNNSNDDDQHTSDNIFCLLRDPFILLPLTFAGNILLSRVWRVVLLLTPVLTLGRNITHHESEEGLTCGNRCKGIIMYYLTSMADFYYYIEWICKSIFPTCNNQQSKVMMSMRRTSTALRKKVPLEQLFLLTFSLTIPQFILQILNLTVPALQERLVMEEDIVFGQFISEKHMCAKQVGNWPLYLGIVLVLIPYILTTIIAWNSAEELPKVFNEAKAYSKCSKVMVLVLAIVIPPLIFDNGTNPNTVVYLSSMLVFALAMPPCWFLVYPKIWLAFTMVDEKNQSSTQARVKRMLRRSRTTSQFLPAKTREDNGKSAKLALTIGKMYEEMGMAQKSIDLFDEALAVWECDPGRENKEKIGGFTLEEINSFTVQDLEHVVNLLIAKGRVNGTFQVADNSGQKNAAQSWLDALEIYEKAPARANMKDRSMLFPVFSGLFVFLKGGKIQQDARCNFEQNLARKFVRETKLQGDPIHYTRALAMFCEVKARLGSYKVALETFQSLREIYDPEEHSEGVGSEYGTDRCAQAFAQAAIWHLQLGDEKRAMEACEYVLDELMPLMDPKNVLNSCEMLLPVIYVYKPRGQEKRMRQLFEKYVVNNHNHFFKESSSPCQPVFKPLTMLLEICHDLHGYPNVKNAVEWLVQEENGVVSDFLDSIYTKLCWSMYSLTAELCLRFAKLLIESNGDLSDVHTLILKGLNLAKKADAKITSSKGKVILPVPYVLHEPVLRELRDLAMDMGMSSDDEFTSVNSSYQASSASGSIAEPNNLPKSYLRNPGGSSSDGSVGSTSTGISNDVVSPNANTVARFESAITSNSSSASVDRGSISRNSRLESHDEESSSSRANVGDSLVLNIDEETSDGYYEEIEGECISDTTAAILRERDLVLRGRRSESGQLRVTFSSNNLENSETPSESSSPELVGKA